MGFLKMLLIATIFTVVNTVWNRIFKIETPEDWRRWFVGVPDFVFGITVALVFFK